MPRQTTEWAGAEPEDTFVEDATKILWDLENWTTDEEPEKEEKKVESKKEEKKTSKEDEWKPAKKDKSEDDLKIPRSRLNKEIDKKNSIQTKYDKLVEKIDKEKDRLSNLSDDDKEEQENLTKLWMDTKLSKLQDKLEDLEDDISYKDTEIKNLKESISKTESSSLSNRINELTTKFDWKDWLPKFDINELIKFWEKEGYLPKDPMKLYNMKYQAEIFAKKYEKSSTKMDKGNKWDNKPVTTKKLNFDRSWEADFTANAEAILNWIWGTT